jgi:hypothetical protein
MLEGYSFDDGSTIMGDVGVGDMSTPFRTGTNGRGHMISAQSTRISGLNSGLDEDWSRSSHPSFRLIRRWGFACRRSTAELVAASKLLSEPSDASVQPATPCSGGSRHDRPPPASARLLNAWLYLQLARRR